MYYVKYDTNLTCQVQIRLHITFYPDNSFQKLAEVDKITFFLFIQHRLFYMV
jgi:hypothetical protein